MKSSEKKDLKMFEFMDNFIIEIDDPKYPWMSLRVVEAKKKATLKELIKKKLPC